MSQLAKTTAHYLTDEPPVRYTHAEFAVPFATDQDAANAMLRMRQWYEAHIHQDLNNNLFGNQPHELDRWADDGGR